MTELPFRGLIHAIDGNSWCVMIVVTQKEEWGNHGSNVFEKHARATAA
jgi:hypothetical protein